MTITNLNSNTKALIVLINRNKTVVIIILYQGRSKLIKFTNLKKIKNMYQGRFFDDVIGGARQFTLRKILLYFILKCSVMFKVH